MYLAYCKPVTGTGQGATPAEINEASQSRFPDDTLAGTTMADYITGALNASRSRQRRTGSGSGPPRSDRLEPVPARLHVGGGRRIVAPPFAVERGHQDRVVQSS